MTPTAVSISTVKHTHPYSEPEMLKHLIKYWYSEQNGNEL